MTSRSLVTIILFLLVSSSLYGQCDKYVFEFGWESVPGNVVIEWKTNDDCRKYPPGYADDKVFVIKVETMFEELLLQDTVTGPRYQFDSRTLETGSLVITAQELNASNRFITLLKMDTRVMKFIRMETQVDSLNMFLLNGCFRNAMALIEGMKRNDLVTEIRKQYEIIFPLGFNPQAINFFNSYVDPSTKNLVQMAYIYETDELIKALNKPVKDRSDKPMDITIVLKVSAESTLQDFTVYPASETEMIHGLLPLLRIDNPRKEASMALLKIHRPYNEKKPNTDYDILNKRALLDPNSPDFKKTFSTSGIGAVHR